MHGGKALTAQETAAEERFRLVVEYSPIAMLLIDAAGAIEMTNTAAEALFGYTRAELTGMSVDMLVPASLRAHHHRLRIDFAADPQPRAINVGRELYAQHKDGRQFPAEIALNPIATQNGPAVLASIIDLSARRKTEQMWRHYASIVSASEDAIISKSMDGTIQSWNPAAERIFGYSEAEILGKPITTLFPPDRLAEEAELMARLARGESVSRYDTVRVRKNGSLVDVSVTLSPILDGFGNVVRASKIAHDITERKKTEKNLRESTALLRAFAEGSPAAVAMFDRDMRYVATSRQWLDERNLADRNIVGQCHYDLFPHFPQRLREVHRRCLAGATERSEEDLFPGEDGSERWLRWEVRPWSYPDGELGGILVWTQDITASKAIHDEVRRLSLTDPLTNLPNRRLLMDRLKVAMLSSQRTGKEGSVLLVDIDHFKRVNDTLGHDAGDALLREAAARLSSSVRASDTVARIGGDEFVVILADLHENPESTITRTSEVARKILANFNLPFSLASQPRTCTVSIGAALFGDHELREDELLRRADRALYRAKAAGRNRLHFDERVPPHHATPQRPRPVQGE